MFLWFKPFKYLFLESLETFLCFFESLVLKALQRAVRPVALRKTTFCSVALRKMSIYPIASRKTKSLHRRFEKNYNLHRNSRKNDTHGPVCGVALGNTTVCSVASGKHINLHGALGKKDNFHRSFEEKQCLAALTVRCWAALAASYPSKCGKGIRG